jgi:hypothetical protein
VACYKNGNNNIRIVGVAVVSSENKDNWTWFVTKLKTHLVIQPAFIISDRDKGLLEAVLFRLVGCAPRLLSPSRLGKLQLKV